MFVYSFLCVCLQFSRLKNASNDYINSTKLSNGLKFIKFISNNSELLKFNEIAYFKTEINLVESIGWVNSNKEKYLLF